jgi:two-component system phosphate regulon sensor histidine kinase PhoR
VLDRILLVEPARARAAGRYTDLGDNVHVDAEQPDGALQVLERGDGISAVVLSPALEDPVAFAQRAHMLDRDVSIVILADPERLDDVERAVQFAPFLGPDVTCHPAEWSSLLGDEVTSAAGRTRRRRSFRVTIDAANEQLAAAPPSRVAPPVSYGSQLLDEVPVGVVTLDLAGRIFGWNRYAVELFGRTEREMLGGLLEDVVGATAAAELDAAVRAARAAREGTAAATLEVSGDSGLRFLEARVSRLRATPQEGLMVLLEDVTDRVFAERGREAARDDLAFLVEAGALLAEAIDLDATIDRVARLAVPRLGDWCIVDVAVDGVFRRAATHAVDSEKLRALDELRERYPVRIDSRQPAARALRERTVVYERDFTREKLEASVSDAEHLRLVETLDPHSVIAAPLVARGEALGALTVVRAGQSPLFEERDMRLVEQLAVRVALAVDAARLLRAAQERAQAALVLDSVADAVILLDNDGIVRLWNPAATRMTGLGGDAVLGRPLDDAFPEWSLVAPQVPVARAPDAEPPLPTTVPLALRDRELWVAIVGVRVPQGVIYAFRDETERMRVERMKSDFVATVSHELRTPLASVYGAAMTLSEHGRALPEETREQMISILAAESERLARIVDDVLLASHIDSRQIAIAQEGVDLVAIARAVVDAASARTTDVRLDLVAPESPRVIGDGDRLRQVLVNLVDNAIKYSEDVREVGVEIERRERTARVWVRDRGRGIPPQERERIFEKFYRLDPEQTRGVGGTGLGLYISRQLVELMGGKIGVEPRAGGGSSFYVELRRALG